MDILLISKHSGLLKQFKVGSANFISITTVLILLLGFFLSGGYYLGIKEGQRKQPDVIFTEIQAQKRFLENLKKDMEEELAAFSSSTAALHGYLSRLDAVADRILQSNNMDSSEFNFGDTSPIGGPQGEAETLQWSELVKNISVLDKEIEFREGKLALLESFLLEKQLYDQINPGGKPISKGWISSVYGYRLHPISGKREFHSGIDFAGKQGSFVRSVASGVVTWSGTRWGYGNMVEINHGNGYVTRYAHNKENLAELGQKVNKGESIALLGSSGMSTGPHVHFEVLYKDKAIDPKKFINEYIEN